MAGSPGSGSLASAARHAPGSIRGRVRAALRTGARGVRSAVSWLHEITGEGAYRAYVVHRQRTHPDEVVMSEREFWRQKYAEEDANPGSRCC